jgi:hypothetical protein
VSINLRKGPRGILSYWLGTAIGDSLDGFACSEGSSAIFEWLDRVACSGKYQNRCIQIGNLHCICLMGSSMVTFLQGRY